MKKFRELETKIHDLECDLRYMRKVIEEVKHDRIDLGINFSYRIRIHELDINKELKNKALRETFLKQIIISNTQFCPDTSAENILLHAARISDNSLFKNFFVKLKEYKTIDEAIGKKT